MTMVYTPGLIWPPMPTVNWSNGFAAGNLVIDATGEKIATNGRIYWGNYDGSETKNITKVGFRFGAVTKAGGSGLTLSLQDVSTTAGPPTQPDGTPDQTVAIANGDAGFAANTWYKTAALSSARTVAYGELLSVVLEYDGAGRLGADSVVVNTYNSANPNLHENNLLYSGGAWGTVSQSFPNILFEFDDGTFGTYRSCYAGKNFSIFNFNSGSNPDEHGNKITLPFDCVVDGVILHAYSITANGEFTVILEDSGGTVLWSETFDYNTFLSNNFGSYQRPLFTTPLTFSAGDVVYLSVRPTAALGVGVAYAEVDHADHWGGWALGSDWYAVNRNNIGAWTEVPTRRMDFHLSIQQIDDGVGTGGGSNNPIYARLRM